LNKSSEIKI